MVTPKLTFGVNKVTQPISHAHNPAPSHMVIWVDLTPDSHTVTPQTHEHEARRSLEAEPFTALHPLERHDRWCDEDLEVSSVEPASDMRASESPECDEDLAELVDAH